MSEVTTAPSAPASQAAAPAAAPAAVPPAAPPAAPAVEAAPAAAPAPQAPTLETPPAAQEPPAALTLNEPVKYKHEATGNAAYDMAMTAFADKGFSPDHPAFLPATKGDFALLEKFVQEKGVDPQFLALARQAHQQISEHHEKVHGETNRKAMEIAGGPERWAKVQAWVQKTADHDELVHWKGQLEAGGIATIKAVEYLSGLYGQHGENAPEPVDLNLNKDPAKPFNDNSSPQLATNAVPLSPQEFREEMGKLISKIGYSGLERSPEYKVLQQRRLAWKP